MDPFHLAVSGTHDGLWDWDLVSNRVHFSPRWAAMVGFDEGDVGSSPDEWLRRVHPEDQPRVQRELDEHLANGVSDFDLRHRMRHHDGSYRWMACRAVIVRDAAGAPVRLMGSHADVTADHVADPLTGLPNRELFVDRLARAIERARRHPDYLYAVLLIDLDRPGSEARAGQPERDPLLTASARRLETGLRGTAESPRPGDDYVVARLRNSQFAVLIEGLGGIGDGRVAADRVLAALLQPLQVHGRQVFPRASIGIAVSATGYTDVDEAMRDADAALYRARSLGGNRCDVFDTDLVQSAEARVALEADLEQALDRGEFRLFYQPVVEAASSRIAGLEALARWQHPTRGMVPPQEFIPVAESTGLIVSLENWTVREACRQLKAWQEHLSIPRDVWVSVNLSGVHFRHPGVVEHVARALRETGLDAACLVLELTESVVVEDPAAVKTLLMQLRMMGVRIGIDDFGTGHSCFAYLHQFPADFLKVDQSFVRGMEVRQDKADIVGTVAGLAAQLGLRVIAEGIETEASLDLVRSRRCDYLQGFLFSRPVAADAAAALLKNGVPVEAASTVGEAVRAADAQEPAPHPSRSRGRTVMCAFATLAIVVSVGVAGQFRRGARDLPTVPSRPASLAVPPAIVLPAPPAASGPDRVATGGVVGPLPRSESSATPAPATTSAVLALAVEHQHVFGGCKGLLHVSSAGVSFVSRDGKDAFTFAPGRFKSRVGHDTLTIRAGQRTYRFKAARIAGNGGTSRDVRRAVDAINDLQAQ